VRSFYAIIAGWVALAHYFYFAGDSVGGIRVNTMEGNAWTGKLRPPFTINLVRGEPN